MFIQSNRGKYFYTSCGFIPVKLKLFIGRLYL